MKEIIITYRIKDLINYESKTKLNILEELSTGNIDIIFDLIKIGLDLEDEEAEKFIDDYIKENGFDKLVYDIAYSVIGRLPDEKTENHDNKKFNSFSEFIDDCFSEIQSIDKNIGLMEFWELSTRQMFTYSDGLKKRFINNKNLEMQSQYNNIAMLMSALAGKLEECPQLDEDGELKRETLENKLEKLGMLLK